MSRIDADGFAAANTQRYWQDVIEQHQLDEKTGLIPLCEIVHQGNRLLRNPCVRYKADPRPKQKIKARLLAARPSILSTIDGLSPRRYEALGCYVARLLGAERYHLTPSGNEGGIDFMAVIRFHTASHIFSGIGREVRLVGQAKKYDSKVQVGHIDAFITTLENIRKRSSRVDSVIPPWFHAQTGPILGWVIGHSGFQSGACSEAQKHGIILSDSRDLAEIITLSRKFHPNKINPNRASELFTEADAILAAFP